MLYNDHGIFAHIVNNSKGGITYSIAATLGGRLTTLGAERETIVRARSEAENRELDPIIKEKSSFNWRIDNMNKNKKGISVLLVLALFLTVAPLTVFAVNESTSSSAFLVPNETPVNASMTVLGDNKVLLIQDHAPWGSPANTAYLDKVGAKYDMVTSAQAVSLDFSAYRMIITANNQNPTILQNLTLIKAKLEQYVSDGGVLFFGICDNSQIPSYTIPGNIVRIYELDNNNKIVDYNHHIVTGEFTDNGALTDAMLYGNQCSHTYFDPLTFPPGTRIILQNTKNNPTLIEYPLGKGMVIASGLTWEWAAINYNPLTGVAAYGPVAMEGYFMYGIALAGGLPQGITFEPGAASLLIGQTLQLTAAILPEDPMFDAITWESDNPTVATVSASGLVTAVGLGEAKITAKTENALTAICVITVNNTHTVTFKDWDGTVLKTEIVNNGSAATAPDEPTRPDYAFIGWDEDFSNITSDLTVTAQYEINKYEVVFVDWDGAVLKTGRIEHGSPAAAPDAPVRAGWIFTGWDADFSSITADLTVTAQYRSSFVLTAAARLIKGGDYFHVNAAFAEKQESNALSISYTFDGDLFSYAAYTPASGATVVDTAFGHGFARITLMIPDYKAENLGDIMLLAKEDAVFDRGWQTVYATADYVMIDEDSQKAIIDVSGSVSFSVNGLPGDTNGDGMVDIIDLSNMIDWFGVIDSSHPDWDTFYSFFDFNDSGDIDIYDVVFVAKLI